MLIDEAKSAIDEIKTAAVALGVAVVTEATLEDGRAAVKQTAILRLMDAENPLTSTIDKPKFHSASSAEAVVEMDPDYLAYRERQHNATISTIMARAAYESAKLTARLFVECVAL